jgi:hypothetical protein
MSQESRINQRINQTVRKKARGIANPQSPRLLTVKRAAEWLGLTTWALRERIWEGQIPVVQFVDGGKMWVDVKDLETFIQRNKRTIQ